MVSEQSATHCLDRLIPNPFPSPDNVQSLSLAKEAVGIRRVRQLFQAPIPHGAHGISNPHRRPTSMSWPNSTTSTTVGAGCTLIRSLENALFVGDPCKDMKQIAS